MVSGLICNTDKMAKLQSFLMHLNKVSESHPLSVSEEKNPEVKKPHRFKNQWKELSLLSETQQSHPQILL